MMAINLSNETWWSFLGIKWIDEKIKEKKTTQQPKLDNTGILSRISDHIAPSSMAT